MSVINFKSVGFTAKKRLQTFPSGSMKPIGFKTPMRLANNSEGLFSMNYAIDTQIADNLRNLLLTNHGERLARYDFGANLQPILYEFSSSKDAFDDIATARIKTAVSRFMPYVKLNTFESTSINKNNLDVGKIRILITYNVPEFLISEQKIELILHVI